jgi:hypothetical protein
MGDEPQVERQEEEVDEQPVEEVEGDLLPDREAMSILNPDPQPLPE